MKDIKLKDKIAQGINDLFYIWKREFQTTFRDQGVLIFFILVPLGYPLLYSFIYDNEVVREVPAVVVDDSHSSLSREYLRKVDATPDIQIVSYCADMEEAKQMLKNRRAYGIIYIPSDFSDNIAKGKQTQVSIYCDMSGLLYYKSMLLTITATRGNYLVLSIPNNNVRKQYYEFLLEEYQDNRHINLNDLGLMYYEMAYEGHWRETMEFIAHAYKENSSVRSSIEGERNLQGFFTAYLSTNAYYLIAPELELNHGYCDLFLMPDLIRYDVKHSYIIELKYLSTKDSEAKAEAQWQEAVEQIKGYAVGAKVRQMVHGTELHCIVMQFRGWELERVEEVMQK